MKIDKVVLTTLYKYMVDVDSYKAVMEYENKFPDAKNLCDELESVEGVFDVYYGSAVFNGVQLKVVEKFNNDLTHTRIKDIIDLYVSNAKRILGE